MARGQPGPAVWGVHRRTLSWRQTTTVGPSRASGSPMGTEGILASRRSETHSLVQDFFFDQDFRLRRHDYSVNIAGGFAASQLTSDYAVANGIHLPTKRRAYTRGPTRRPILDMLMVWIDISEVSFA